MAACSINIAEELYSLLVNEPYETDVQTIDADTQPNPEELKKVRKLLDKAYKLDTSHFQTRCRNCIPNGMNYSANILEEMPKPSETNCMTGYKTRTTTYDQ